MTGGGIKANALGPGARVAVIAPAGPVNHEKLEAGLSKLRTLGFVPKLGEAVLSRHLHFAGTAEARFADLRWALTDPNIDGVVCARGGEGTTSLLPWFASIEVAPRVFCGYSDITALHGALLRRGLVSFHGPMVAAEFASDRFDLPRFMGEVTGEDVEPAMQFGGIRAGEASGILVGGCLSILCATAGTQWGLPWLDADASGSFPSTILLLEDVDEKPYRIHRMLTHLRDSGGLNGVGGIVFGGMGNCFPLPDAGYTLRDIILDALQGFEGPIGFGLALGHETERKIATLPLGVPARLLVQDDSDLFERGGTLQMQGLGVERL